MSKFYVTYACDSNLDHKYSVIEAENYVSARDQIFQVIGPAFAFMYDERGFAGQVEKYHLQQVPLQAQVYNDD